MKSRIEGAVARPDLSQVAAVVNVVTPTTYALTVADIGKFIVMGGSDAGTFTVPTNTTAAIPTRTVILIGASASTTSVNIAGEPGVTILSASGLYLRTNYSVATLLKTSSNQWWAFGDLTT